jgi:photosystem II stability/assembly factor-like uncharacterized protein
MAARRGKQSAVPVSSDLTSVFFIDDKQGWAVGHDGVILHTDDGGDRWQLQLTGRAANDALIAAMERSVAAEPASEDAKKLLAEAKRYKEQGADKPFLDVWFADGKNGIRGGRVQPDLSHERRRQDVGAVVRPHRQSEILQPVRDTRVAGELYIAGEGGLVLKLDASGQRFKGLVTPYNGSYFGIADAGNAVLVFGLRGNVFRSEDRGATWTKVDAGLPAAIVGSARTPQAPRCWLTWVDESSSSTMAAGHSAS